MLNKYSTIEDAAAYLQIPQERVADYCHNGMLTCKRAGKRYIIDNMSLKYFRDIKQPTLLPQEQNVANYKAYLDEHEKKLKERYDDAVAAERSELQGFLGYIAYGRNIARMIRLMVHLSDAKVSERDLDIVERYYNGDSLRKIAQNYGVTRETARVTVIKVMNRLKYSETQLNRMDDENKQLRQRLALQHSHIKRLQSAIKSGLQEQQLEASKRRVPQVRKHALALSVLDITMSVRLRNVLLCNELTTLGDVLDYCQANGKRSLLNLRSMGKKSADEITELMQRTFPENWHRIPESV